MTDTLDRSEHGHVDVLIVGAGPTGLVLAIELRRRGASVCVVDRASSKPTNSRATDIHSRSLEIFDAIGVSDAIVARGKKVRTFNAFSAGRCVSRLDLGRVGSRFPFTIALPQNEVEAVLESRLATLGGRVARGVALVGLTQKPSHVELSFCAPGSSSDHPLPTAARFVVGCDGIGSTVRSLSDTPFVGTTYAQRYVVADLNVDWDLADDEVHLFMDKGGFFNVIALPGRARCRILCDIGDTKTDVSLDLVASLLARRTHRKARLYDPTMMTTFSIQRRLVPEYRRGRVLLAGDAAHTCSPLLGQGMNLGIHDAWNLGWKLDLVMRGTSSDALLDTYAIERRRVARAVLFHTDMVHRTARLENSWLAGARDVASRVASQADSIRACAANLCSGLGVSYPGDGLAVDRGATAAMTPLAEVRSLLRVFVPWPRGGPPQPGDRAPLPLGNTPSSARLSSVLARANHSLLVFLGEEETGVEDGAARLIATVRERFGSLVATSVFARRAGGTSGAVADPTYELHDCYHARQGALYLVRPDGHIGYRSNGTDGAGLVGHLGTLFTSAPHRLERPDARASLLGVPP